MTAVRPSAELKQIAITLFGDGGSVTVSGDALRLQQVFWNLLTNAIKFTPVGGEVHMLSSVKGDQVQVDVRDTGEGFSADFLPRIFDRYTQADTSRCYVSGLGLGLSIARTIVELHEGSISAFSDGEGKGATFSVTLPIVRAV